MWGKGILNGMRITMRNMLRGPITVRYPYERVTLPERARWAVEVVRDESGAHKCTACMTCVRACPDHILDLQFTTAEDKSKHIDYLRYEMGACMMCGLCVEACPFGALKMGQDYELAKYTRDELTVDLMVDEPAAAPVRAKRASEAPAAGGAKDARGGDSDG